MKKLIAVLLLLPLTAFAHNWPYPVPDDDDIEGPVKAGFCFNASNCTTSWLQGRAQLKAEQTWCLNGVCVLPNSTYVEVHNGEYWYQGLLSGKYRREWHWLFVVVKDFPNVGEDYMQPAGSHSSNHCPDHHYSPNLYY